MRLAKALGVISLTALLFAGCGRDPGLDGLADGGRGVVAEAIAGDALVLTDGRRVRLAGVEAPHGADPYAVAAREALQSLAKGREVQLLHGGARTDPYGRLLAQLRDRKSRAWLQGTLLEAGAVRERTYPDNRALARAMQTAEARARIARRGLWALPDYRVRLPQELGEGDSGFALVEGRAARVVRSGRSLFIDFETGAGRPLSTETPLLVEPDFAAAGIDFTRLRGRLIRVRGSLYRSRIRLDHPEQVELLAEPGVQ
jgi:endonuclease YncB( thermonuclease family)